MNQIVQHHTTSIKNNLPGPIAVNGGIALLGDSTGLNLNIQQAMFVIAGPDGPINLQQLLNGLQNNPRALLQSQSPENRRTADAGPPNQFKTLSRDQYQ